MVRLGGGITNAVFRVDHPEGEFVVRLSPEPAKIKEYLKEQWAIARAREAGVPTPEVLEVGAEVAPFPYMVMRKVEGREATHHPERMAILREMGRLTALIHTVRTSGFGHTFDWSGNRLSRKETWGDYLRRELRLDERVALLDRLGMLTRPQLRTLRATLRGMAGLEEGPSLNHGDMRLKNVMVAEDGAVTAVIDWEFCTSNIAPYWDLSLALHDLSIDAKQAFLGGYGLREAEIVEMAPVLKALNILNYAPFVERAAEEGDEERLSQFRVRLSGALDLYSF